MNKVPKMISNKDLDYISDMINWNLTNAKKANHYKQESEDEEVIDIFERITFIFKDHYSFLLNLLR